MPKLVATTTTTTEVQISPQLKRKLLKELREYQVLKTQQDELKARMNRKKEAIATLRNETGEISVCLEGFTTTLVSGLTTTKLDKKKLIALGCAPAWIEEATVTTPKKSFEKITLPGEKDEEE